MKFFDELYETVERWQEVKQRTTRSSIKKLEEELVEYHEATDQIEELEELGDVLMLAVRTVSTLTYAEKEFIRRTTKMKADRRLVNPKKKDKSIEREIMLEIAKELGLLL